MRCFLFSLVLASGLHRGHFVFISAYIKTEKGNLTFILNVTLLYLTFIYSEILAVEYFWLYLCFWCGLLLAC